VPAGDLLRQLDRRLLPLLVRGMVRLGHHRLRPRVLTGTALLSLAAVLATAVWAADRPLTGPTVDEVTRVGVVQGESIPRYVAASRTKLARLVDAPQVGTERPTYALVTLTAYLAPDRLTPVLAGVEVAEVFARLWRPETWAQSVRIPAPRIPDDVIAGMARVAEHKEREAREYRQRSAEIVGDGEPERQLRAYYEAGALAARDEATAYRARCSCVYAAVVRAAPGALDRIAARPEVRAVDPAPEVDRLDRVVFSPPLPEQDDVVEAPLDVEPPVDPAAPVAVYPSPVLSEAPADTPLGGVLPSVDPTAPVEPGLGDPSVPVPPSAPADPTVPVDPTRPAAPSSTTVTQLPEPSASADGDPAGDPAVTVGPATEATAGFPEGGPIGN
jgi:hypothetical protein